MMRRRGFVVLGIAALLGGALPVGRAALPVDLPVVDPTVEPARDTEPVVLSGSAFGAWAAPAEVTVKAPTPDGPRCAGGDESACTHSRYEEPEVATGDTLGAGVPIDRLLGYRWDTAAGTFVEIPFQVDELAVRYLSNNASGFAYYSWTDQHPTFVFDEERFRWTEEDPANPCRAVPRDGVTTTPDPVSGLDTDDEVAFLAADAGPVAPHGASLPPGIESMKQVVVLDPYRPDEVRSVYVGLASATGPRPAYDATNGYVRYEPDADADTFLFSESSYEDYGNTYQGAWLDPATGTCVTDDPRQHRPKDTAWVRTPRYAFRYSGRWLMTEIRVAPPGAPATTDATQWSYGPDLVDQWKARAFQQRPGGETPCCGFEEEVDNWGGSSLLMGVRAGPVRVIRATWGADSSTNNVRTEIFYRDEFRQIDYLRVHPVPPLDGIYSQWDYNAGKITQYYNPWVPDGVPVDGRNDEVFGNTRMRVAVDGVHVEDPDPIPVLGPVDVGVGRDGSCPDTGLVDDACVNNDVDVPDPTMSGPNPSLNYEQVTGPFGTLVHRTGARQVTAGMAHAVTTVPYYRDDACFDDGTGTDPGPHLNPRDVDPDVGSDGRPRACWTPEMGDPEGVSPRDHLYQGAIGTHGVHIEIIVDSDNAMTTVPLTEIDSETRIVVLPGLQPNVGEAYGRGAEKPLVALVI
jgi:hypothetical protein